MLAYLGAALTYAAVATGCAILVYHVARRQVPGRFRGALIVGLIGAVLGGIVDQFLPDVFTAGVLGRADVATVNLFTATGVSLSCLWLLSVAGRSG